MLCRAGAICLATQAMIERRLHVCLVANKVGARGIQLVCLPVIGLNSVVTRRP